MLSVKPRTTAPQDAFTATSSAPGPWSYRRGEIFGLSFEFLDDGAALRACAARASLGRSRPTAIQHRFQPQGQSLVLLTSELRVYIHTWPELGALSLDVVASSEGVAEAIWLRLEQMLAASGKVVASTSK